MFCLEVIQEQLPNIIGCACDYKYHKECLDKWFEEKGQNECPICHTVAIPVEIERRRYVNGVDRAVGVCCSLLCLGWIVAFVVLRNVV
jgi:hypothetical protein